MVLLLKEHKRVEVVFKIMLRPEFDSPRVQLKNPQYGSQKDEFSPFRRHLLSAKQRKKECSLTLQDIKEQWDKQQGICPFTGWKLINGISLNPKDQLPLTPNRASLDRIDSSKGYHKDNIQFISVIAQYAKNIFSEKELIKFCQDVTLNMGK